MSHTFELIRNANVELKQVVSDRKTHAEIIIDGRFEHRFDSKSRVSKHLEMMSVEDLQQRLTGGSFFLVDDKLVDFRDGMYNGFIHGDDAIAKFMDVIGVQERVKRQRRQRGRNDDMPATALELRALWTSSDIVVPNYQQGGEFSSKLWFEWNPFVKTINTAFELERLICTNGMVGLTPLVNARIPLFNRWQEHLDIAAKQIQNKVDSIVQRRVHTMANSRASVGDLLLLGQHAADRLHAQGEKMEGERARLLAMVAAMSPQLHLSHIYKSDVFSDRNLASQMPSHLTYFDVYNLATEMRSHTTEDGKSSNHALDRIANSLMFDRDEDFTTNAAAMTAPRLAVFSSAEQAFWGDIDA